MGKKGRPKLSGKRNGGRRILAQQWDHGTDHVQASRARFARFQDGKAAQQVFDPIGRAWAVGLLENDRVDPAVLRDAGRKYAARYWGYYPAVGPAAAGVANYTQEIRKGPTSIDGADPMGERFAKLDTMLASAGRAALLAVHELCVDSHWFPDTNPGWLDRLIDDRFLRKSRFTRYGDADTMACAMGGLMAMAVDVETRRAAA